MFQIAEMVQPQSFVVSWTWPVTVSRHISRSRLELCVPVIELDTGREITEAADELIHGENETTQLRSTGCQQAVNTWAGSGSWIVKKEYNEITRKPHGYLILL